MSILLRIIGFVFNLIILLLGIRFAFRLFGADPQNLVVAAIYNWSAVLLEPFRGMFPVTAEDGAVFEWSTVAAIILYGLLYWLIVALVRAVTPAESDEEYVVHKRSDRYHHAES